MKAENLLNITGADFYTGVPDSQLKPVCDCLMHTYGTDPRHHIIAANEGNAAALAAGYYLATGKVPAVYLQNSGEGNIINPLASLMHKAVYGIPCIFIIGWRGEPGVRDEPQHVFQGEITCRLLEDMGIDFFTVGRETTDDQVRAVMGNFRENLFIRRNLAFVIRKGALTYDRNVQYTNGYGLQREEVIRRISAVSGEDAVIASTGKISRELFEIRKERGQGHERDFLTVGSMGHASSIALGIAIQRPEKRVWCIDGDGAVLMHMGALAVIGSIRPANMVHVVINNGAHETVGGQPTVMSEINIADIAKSCGYTRVISASDLCELDEALRIIQYAEELVFLEIKCSIGSRADLGRPAKSTHENKEEFMRYIQGW